MIKKKLIRITTIPISLAILLKGQLNYMKQFYDVVGISSPGDALNMVEKNEGIPVIAVKMTRRISPLQDLISLWTLYRVFKAEKPFIVHTHTPKAGTVGMIAAKLAGVPNRLHTVAGLPLLEAQGIKRKLLNLIEKLTYACATFVYPNSRGLYEIILNNNFAEGTKLKLIGEGSSNGIDTTYFDPKSISLETKKVLRKSLNIHDGDFVYVFVGRLVKDKGLNELVSAFKTINAKQPNTKLILVGGHNLAIDPLSTSTLQEIESNKDIIAVGSQKDVRPYFALSDVLVFPSYREGFPNVVMQAGAMGLPSIVSDINGCNEIIISGKNGYIVPVKNESALKQAMAKALCEKDKLASMRQDCRLLIQSRYNREEIWASILREYISLEN